MPRAKAPFFVLAGLASIAVAIGLGITWGLPALLLFLAGAALSLVIALVWSSLTGLSGDLEMTFDEALSLAAPTVEEEQKRAVLRALKDLEYELFVGKISREDYDDLSRKYREQARRLIALADESLGQRLDLAERRLREALEEQERSLEQRSRRSSGKKNRRKRRESPTTTSEESPRARLRQRDLQSRDLQPEELDQTKRGKGLEESEGAREDQDSRHRPRAEEDA